MNITITLTEEEQEILLAEARVKGIFNLDGLLWASIARKIRFKGEEYERAGSP